MKKSKKDFLVVEEEFKFNNMDERKKVLEELLINIIRKTEEV